MKEAGVIESCVVEDGLRVVVVLDDDPESPRDWDNLGKLICFHRRYDLGDKCHGYREQDFNSWDELERRLKKDGAVIIKPLYMYDHSILDIATQVQPYWWHYAWDGGQVGFAVVFRQDILEEFKVKRITQDTRQQAEKLLDAEVDVYAKYLRGEVYGYRVAHDGETVESCWGFYDSNQAFEEGVDAAEHYKLEVI